MTEQTPGTSTDPALGSEGDNDQLPSEDTLVDRGVADLLDEGYSPPDHERTYRWGETPWEEAQGEGLDRRLSQEEPDVWDVERPRPGGEPDRAGRLVQDADAVDAGGNDQFAADAGIAGGGASAEEAAVHVVDDDELDGRFDPDR